MFKFDIDLSAITDLLGSEGRLEQEFEKSAKVLAASIHAHIIEEAQQKLNSTRKMFVDNLTFFQDGDVWIVQLDGKAVWIDDGAPATSMLERFLASPKAKTTKDGQGKYLIIPFQHNGKPSTQTPAQKSLSDTVRGALKARKIPYGGIEKNADGSPKLGLLHRVNGIQDNPSGAHDSGNLQRLNIYQKEVTDKKGNKSVSKFIATFRTASSSPLGSGKWERPASEGHHLMDEAVDWAQKQIDDEVIPRIIASML
jgi:hypothetical protein